MDKFIAVVAGVAALGAMALADPGEVRAEVPQTEFPCQEDEVLGYAPQFGPDNVGCIHVEDLVA